MKLWHLRVVLYIYLALESSVVLDTLFNVFVHFTNCNIGYNPPKYPQNVALKAKFFSFLGGFVEYCAR